ncbi:NAD(+) synthase [Candidatus Soleaferrea massiliensis]|uniref:NAD(+) synthase n=1 Tax=Candidatus Soleaferrea massiliensis TaxID=1470354 RepID=UPI00058E7F38|nr:NAD(+) synthase [Candidatus Soleaferrea massiliensis]
MNSIVRVCCIANRTEPANPFACYEYVQRAIDEVRKANADIIVFPKYALSSASCGSLFGNAALLETCRVSLEQLGAATKDIGAYIVIGLPVKVGSKVISAFAVLHQGSILGYIPEDEEAFSYGLPEEFLPADTVFRCGSLRFCVAPLDLNRLYSGVQSYLDTGFDLMVVPSYQPVHAGDTARWSESARVLTRELGCAVAICNGGISDTSSPHIFKGYHAVYECGRLLAGKQGGVQTIVSMCDLDTDVIGASKQFTGYQPSFHHIDCSIDKQKLLRPVEKNPFLPLENPTDYLDELFELQILSLANRLENTGFKKIILGVSGGSDSTLALLVAAKALDILGLPRTNLIGITMPGFGTTDRTYYNALSLLDILGCSHQDISIKQSVMQHFEDIMHDVSNHDATYENAQARERTQILLDLANKHHGLVLGTGDLSEEALGWCTFGGDQLANYNVNTCVTKTTIRLMLEHLSNTALFENAREILADILQTPVSPELLPPDESGNIHQKTEEILGPYELHDFFLYYFIKYGMRPTKVYYYACIAFADELDPQFIRQKLQLFLKRLFGGQFKRSCAPDSADITEMSLANVKFYIPSDANADAFLKELESTDFA